MSAILLIDDDPRMLAMIQRILQSENYQVATAASGALDDFHAFDFGWLASFRRSAFDHADHRARSAEGWDRVFDDADDPALLVIVQSWMQMPWDGFFGAMRRNLNISHAEGLGEGPM